MSPLSLCDAHHHRRQSVHSDHMYHIMMREYVQSGPRKKHTRTHTHAFTSAHLCAALSIKSRAELKTKNECVVIPSFVSFSFPVTWADGRCAAMTRNDNTHDTPFTHPINSVSMLRSHENKFFNCTVRNVCIRSRSGQIRRGAERRG